MDRDLASVQEVRELLKKAKEAEEILKDMSQSQVDGIVENMAKEGYNHAAELARMAVEETGFGVYEDKIIKNRFATEHLANFIRDMKTVGIIAEYPGKKMVEIAAPMGVVAGIVPSTNPTSTAMYKAIISVKSRNTIVLSPHPSAVKCTMRAAEIVHRAAVAAGAPEGVVGCMSIPTMEGTHELMHHPITSVILATGGSAMVKAAYSAGKPAFGVGPGNVPAFIERSADIKKAVRDIFTSKTFDNGTICASEQAIVTEHVIKEEVIREIRRQGGYFLSPAEADQLAKAVVQPRGGLNPQIVGQPAVKIAAMAGLAVPDGTRVLVAPQGGVGKDYPLSMEKLSPILAFYAEENWEQACERCIELLNFGGIGHSLVIHSQNEQVIREFAFKKPVFRILVNTPSSQGAIGYSTGLDPALTLGCGTWGGSITSDNVTPLHLINKKRLAYGIRDVAPSLRAATVAPASVYGAPDRRPGATMLPQISERDIAQIVDKYLSRCVHCHRCGGTGACVCQN